MKKRAAAVGSLFILTVWFFLCGFTAPKATTELYTADYANVLQPADKQHIVTLSEKLQTACGAQLAVLTTTDLQNMDIEEYARLTAREWGLGDKEKNNGLLIVLSLGDQRAIWVTVGTGLEGCLNDGKVGRFIDDYAMDDLKDGNYSAGIVKLYDEILNVVMNEYDIAELDGFQAHEEASGIGAEVIVAIIIVVIIIIASAGFRGGRGGFYGGFRGGFGGGFSGGRPSGGNFGGGGGFSGGGAGRSFCVCSPLN